MPTVEIPGEYGYVLLVVVATGCLNAWHFLKISDLRRRLGVDCPRVYSERHHEFNCAQRVHQNNLEQLPVFLPNLLLGGLNHPVAASAFGAVFVFARILYSLGYYSGDPERRIPGSILATLGGLLPLNVLTLKTAVEMLGWK